MKTPKILVVGSFVMDQLVNTAIFPREGQTVLGQKFTKAPGGKGANQASQAARLGAEVTMVGKLGYDANGEELLKACHNLGINTDYVLRDEKESSGCAVIILEKDANGQTKNRIIVIPGSNMTISPEEIAFVKDILPEYDMVMLQLEIPMSINEQVAAWAYEAGVPVMLNSAPSDRLSDELLSHLAYISPNEHEAADLTGITIAHEGDTYDREAAEKVVASLMARGVKNVLVTMGESGAVFGNESGLTYSPCARGITAVDPTAAGDSFVASFCYSICSGVPVEEAMRFANHAAALTVSGMGAIPSLPSLADVREMLKSRGF